eukprot:scaffold17494_cov103-Isochrysis_galbana.AAC.4
MHCGPNCTWWWAELVMAVAMPNRWHRMRPSRIRDAVQSGAPHTYSTAEVVVAAGVRCRWSPPWPALEALLPLYTKVKGHWAGGRVDELLPPLPLSGGARLGFSG